MMIERSLERPSYRPIQGFRALAMALPLMMGFAVGASAAPYNPSNLPADELNAVARTCQSVIGLSPGESHYVGCVESLSDSLRGSDRGRQMARARSDCIDQGLKPDTPELATCTLNTGAARSSTSVGRREVSQVDEAVPAKSYFSTSPRDVHRREEQSCARLGFDPTTGAFARCVAGLQASLFAADNPMN